MKTKINIKNQKENIEIIAKKCNSFQKISGLMFKTSKTMPLLFDFSDEKNIAIHSFFVFFSFYAIWLDKDNKIIEIRKVEPFTFCVRPKKPFSRLLELPVNEKYSEILRILTHGSFYDDLT